MSGEQVNPLQPRWQRILQCDDDALLWKAIDRKGQFNAAVTKLQPTESEFQQHLERLLDPVGEVMSTDLSDYRISVPVLDNEIEANEIKYLIAKQVKTNKGCGPDGISPGVFKLLPDSWISFLCIFLNVIFVANYPLLWTSARLIMLFKKGSHLDCNNYRGISIINAIANVYDYVLNNWLMLWYRPYREQAGAQPNVDV